MMSPKPFVLARRITNLTDARYFAAKAVTYLGFNMEPGTDGYLDPMYMQAMREWVEGPVITGEFNDGTAVSVINEAIRFYQLGAVIVPSSINIEDIHGADVIVKVHVTPESLGVIPVAAERATAVLLESSPPSWSWLDLKDKWVGISLPIVLQFDGSLLELKAVLLQWNIAGISLIGGEEEAVGIKSFDDVEDIFDFLEDSDE